MRRGFLLPLACTLACAPACSHGSGGAGASDDAPPRGAVTTTALAPAASGARLVPTFTPADAGEATAPGPSPVPLGSAAGPHAPRPRVRDVPPTLSNAGLPPEIVRRIVRQNFGRFRLCYENGLRADPTLEGEVKVRFVIDTDGAVSVASDAGSTLADAAVVTCVTHAFSALSFPTPSAGSLVVVYPLYFAPASAPASP